MFCSLFLVIDHEIALNLDNTNFPISTTYLMTPIKVKILTCNAGHREESDESSAQIVADDDCIDIAERKIGDHAEDASNHSIVWHGL